MKKCDECRKSDGSLHHPSSVGCNWLDSSTTCPHCDGPLRYFRGLALGDLMDEMSMEPTADTGGFVSRRKRPHQVHAYGTQGGIVAVCNDCEVVETFDFMAEYEAWKTNHIGGPDGG